MRPGSFSTTETAFTRDPHRNYPRGLRVIFAVSCGSTTGYTTGEYRGLSRING